YWLLPQVLTYSNRQQAQDEARLKKALEIITYKADFETKANSILTLLDTFRSDAELLKPGGAALRQMQSALLKECNSRYLELDRIAWWWYPNFYQEWATIHDVRTEESTNLKPYIATLGRDYQENLVATTQLLSGLKAIYVATTFNPSNNDNPRIAAEVRNEWDCLLGARSEIVYKMVICFRDGRVPAGTSDGPNQVSPSSP